MRTLLLAADFAAKRKELASDSATNAEAYYDNAMRAELRKQWMPIEEAPMSGNTCLLCHVEGVPFIGYTFDGLEWFREDRSPTSPTHFMPLPEPPNGK